jgi:DUF1680 family protein
VNTCCEGQGTRLLASLPEFIFSTTAEGLYVNLYQPAAIEWPLADGAIRLTMRTDFPRDGAVRLSIETPKPQRAKLRIRIPSWAARDMPLQVNDSVVASGKPGSYETLDREWSTGDIVSFTLPMGLKLIRYTGTDQVQGHERFALQYGPLLMAMLGAADPELILFGADGPEDLLARLRPEEGNGNHFVLSRPEFLGPPVHFIPYFEIADQSFTCFPLIECRAALFP